MDCVGPRRRRAGGVVKTGGFGGVELRLGRVHRQGQGDASGKAAAAATHQDMVDAGAEFGGLGGDLNPTVA